MKRAAKPHLKNEQEKVWQHTGFDFGGAEDVPALVEYVRADLRVPPECLASLLADAFFIYSGGSEAILDLWKQDRARVSALHSATRRLRKALPGDRIPITHGLAGAIWAAHERGQQEGVEHTAAPDRTQTPSAASGFNKEDWAEKATAAFTADLFTLLNTLDDAAKREIARLDGALIRTRTEVGDLGARDIIGGNLPLIFTHAFKRPGRGKAGEAQPEAARERFVRRVAELMGFGILSTLNIRKYRSRFNADWKAGLVNRCCPQPTSPDVCAMSMRDLPGAALGPRFEKGGTV